jgi:GNAT superfamily N-acetyltransferase
VTHSTAVTDLALARRLEGTEGRSNAAFVESRALHQPNAGAVWREVAGTMAMFDGVGSPLTQTFCLGLFAPCDAAVLGEMETFFAERGSNTLHEVCPLSDANVLTLLSERGYRPIEQSTVLWQPLIASTASAPDASAHDASAHDASAHHACARGARTPNVRRIDADEVMTWADYAARGWGATAELADFMRNFGAVIGSARGTSCFVAELDGAIIGTASLNMQDGVALLAGASTLPEFRGRGAQSVLLRARLSYALAAGCDIAMMAALPGSTSQTNAERQGFRIAYTRTKWQRSHAS